MGEGHQSWGRYPPARHKIVPLAPGSTELPPDLGRRLFLPVGNGRSYGDSCLLPDGTLLDCRPNAGIGRFDPKTGVLRCRAGTLLSDILAFVIPHGWFLPVTPGTKFVTVGGAIANDVHGKNHHAAGTFGRHVRGFTLIRTDGSMRVCSPSQNPNWFRATVGGMGLTGVIGEAELQLMPVASPDVDLETIRFSSLDGFFELEAESASTHFYTVAWIDSLARGSALGRGLFMRADHAEAIPGRDAPRIAGPRVSVPVTPPFPLVTRTTLTLFNAFYHRQHLHRRRRGRASFESFFYPLDAIGNWNRLYGPKGLLQHQSIVPDAVAPVILRDLIELSQAAGAGSFLTVLKRFGDIRSPGLLSFPRAGVTLTLDFANRGSATFTLLDQLDALVREAGGAVNPYKDARMSPATFEASFPDWRDILPYRDSQITSGFWSRVAHDRRPARRAVTELAE